MQKSLIVYRAKLIAYRNKIEEIANLAKIICKRLVINEEDVFVSFYYTRHRGTVVITAPKDEVKRIIGKYGNNIKSLRIILNAVAAKKGIQLIIQVKNI